MRNKSKLLKLPSSWYARNESVPCLRRAHGWYTEYASSSWYDNKTLLAFFPGFVAWAFSAEWQRYNRDVNKQVEYNMVFIKVLLRRKFLSLFPSFFHINLFYRFKIIEIAKNLNLTCVRGLEISFQKVRKYRPPLHSSQNNSPRDLRKAVLRLTTWVMHCNVETSTKRFALGRAVGKSLWARSIQPKFQPVRPGKEDHLKRWNCFFQAFPVGPNRSIEFWTEISGNFGWMDRACRLNPNGLPPVLLEATQKKFITWKKICLTSFLTKKI